MSRYQLEQIELLENSLKLALGKVGRQEDELNKCGAVMQTQEAQIEYSEVEIKRQDVEIRAQAELLKIADLRINRQNEEIARLEKIAAGNIDKIIIDQILVSCGACNGSGYVVSLKNRISGVLKSVCPVCGGIGTRPISPAEELKLVEEEKTKTRGSEIVGSMRSFQHENQSVFDDAFKRIDDEEAEEVEEEKHVKLALNTQYGKFGNSHGLIECESCDGRGFIPPSPGVEVGNFNCLVCEGRGHHPIVLKEKVDRCKKCFGRGEMTIGIKGDGDTRFARCDHCNGTRIEPGVEDDDS